MGPELRIAYITTHYPALSHTFILREVSALRRLGVRVHTISMQEATGEHLLGEENLAAARSTYAIRPPRWSALLSVHLNALALHPRAYLATLGRALRRGTPGPRGRLWQVFYFGQAIALWHHCQMLGARHIHAHHASAPADVALLAAHFGGGSGVGPASFSLTVHGPVEFQDVRWFSLAEKVRSARAVVCISDFARSQLMALVDEPHWAKLRIVHCGVDPGSIGAPPTSDEEQGIVRARRPAGRFARARVLCVGRLVPEKGHAVLLEAVELLGRAGHEVELEIVGSGPLRTRLEALAEELGLAARVSFRGALAQEQLAHCYARASVFCSASFAEGVPVVLMEAMACGCPVIATAIAGVRELVLDEETGLLVSPGRADELAAAIATLLRSPRLRADLAGRAREHLLSEFSADRSAAQLQALFSEILGLPDGGREAPHPTTRDLVPVA